MVRVSDDQWRAYYDAMRGLPPRDTLLFALDRFDAEGEQNAAPHTAVDLGCGEGRDTVEILRRGWRVDAVDAQEEGIRRLLLRPDLVFRGNLSTHAARFDAFQWPPVVGLVNAGYSLPFCAPDIFPAVWKRLVDALAPGGRFCGQFFGDRDGWSDSVGMTFHTHDAALELLAPLVIERFDEDERDGATAGGQPKHWHVFNIVVRKPGAS